MNWNILKSKKRKEQKLIKKSKSPKKKNRIYKIIEIDYKNGEFRKKRGRR